MTKKVKTGFWHELLHFSSTKAEWSSSRTILRPLREYLLVNQQLGSYAQHTSRPSKPQNLNHDFCKLIIIYIDIYFNIYVNEKYNKANIALLKRYPERLGFPSLLNRDGK